MFVVVLHVLKLVVYNAGPVKNHGSTYNLIDRLAAPGVNGEPLTACTNTSWTVRYVRPGIKSRTDIGL
jgi:hypothetical protein